MGCGHLPEIDGFASLLLRGQMASKPPLWLRQEQFSLRTPRPYGSGLDHLDGGGCRFQHLQLRGVI